MGHVLNDEGDLRNDAFLAGAIAEIPADRLGDGLGIVAAEIGDPVQVRLALVDGAVALGLEGGLLGLQHLFHAFDLLGFGFTHECFP